MKKKKILILVFLNIAIFILGLEIASRAFWEIKYDVPFLNSSEIIYGFYPEVYNAKQEYKNNPNSIKILLLGASVLNPKHGSIEIQLENKLSILLDTLVTVINVSRSAHTSMDSKIKYSLLKDEHFDYVLFYHSINDLRNNNIIHSKYLNDYSHNFWYKSIYTAFAHKEKSILTFPLTIHLLYLKFLRKFGIDEFIPRNALVKEWIVYGDSIKTIVAFNDNINSIINNANSKKEKLIIGRYAYYIPLNYSNELFLNRNLDYDKHKYSIQILGNKENIIKGLKKHDSILLLKKDNTLFFDAHGLLPDTGLYFDDPCHLTEKACSLFADSLANMIFIDYINKK